MLRPFPRTGLVPTLAIPTAPSRVDEGADTLARPRKPPTRPPTSAGTHGVEMMEMAQSRMMEMEKNGSGFQGVRGLLFHGYWKKRDLFSKASVPTVTQLKPNY